jgi:hypothetical protein
MKIKTIIYVLLVIATYYFLSVYFTKNGQFIQHYHSNSDSKKESKEKDIFITDNLKISILKDSASIIKNSFDIWIDNKEVTRQYGILPFIRITSLDKSLKGFNINFKENLSQNFKDNILMKINNGELMGNYTIMTQYVNPKGIVVVDFYMKDKKNSFGQIKVKVE